GRFLAVEYYRRYCRAYALLAAQHHLQAFFDKLAAHPPDHRLVGVERFDNLTVAPVLAKFGSSALISIRAFNSRFAALLPWLSNICSCVRSVSVSLTMYFSVRCLLAAMRISFESMNSQPQAAVDIESDSRADGDTYSH
ncbi:MAG: hypothetical protein ACFCUR_14135, partial [Rhodomicrobiaceae bacterium]